MSLKTVDKNILEGNFELALNKLNFLIKEEYKPSTTYLKRGKLCKKLLMYDDAYSDFTYIIGHCANKKEAYKERLFLNYEIANFFEAIADAEIVLSWDEDNFEVKRIKFLSLIYSTQEDLALEYLMQLFDYNKYKTVQFLFNEVALALAKDEYMKALKLLELIDKIDKDNPIKLLKEANIYGLVGKKDKERTLLEEINSTFPKYFVSHFRFSDMYQEKDLLEICFLLELKIFDKQGLFLYPFAVLEGYKNHLEGHITDSKECFEKAIRINPTKPEGYVLLAQTLQLMSGYDNPEYKVSAEENYKKALEIYQNENLPEKVEDMKRQIKHLNSKLSFK
jgi:tetratricopeptide (TPR) repeat protein